MILFKYSTDSVVRIIPTLRSILLIIFLSITIGACASRQPTVIEQKAKHSTSTYYIVKTGDNLASIAFFLSTTPGILLRLNPQIQNQNIKPGMRLITPSSQIDGNTGQSENAESSFIWPIKIIDLSSRFGTRNGRFHAGIDLRAPKGTAIVSSAHGKVIFSGRQNGYGKTIIIKHSSKVQTVYAHNLNNLVDVGQIVKKGQTIAMVGRSGNATGYHVHFEFRINGKPVNPVKHLRK